MTVFIIRMGFFLTILWPIFFLFGLIWNPYFFALSCPIAWVSGWLKREAQIIFTGKWYDGRDLT